MKNRWLVRSYILPFVGITTGVLAACGPAGEVEPPPTTTPTESAPMMVEKQPTPEVETVEDAPTEEMMPTETATLQAQPTPTEAVQPTDTPTVEPEPIEAIEPTTTPSPEAEPTEESPVVLRQGEFTDADQNHTGSGTATLYQEPDGSYRLSFENFTVCCGPDLYVFLASNPSPTGHADLGDYVEISPLQTPNGDQEYKIPAGTDLSQINSVVIYCKPFQVIISTATLG